MKEAVILTDIFEILKGSKKKYDSILDENELEYSYENE